MEKITSIGMQNTHLQMMQEMQRMASMSGSQLELGGVGITEAASASRNVAFSSVLNQALNNVDHLQTVASDKQTAVDMGLSDDLAGTMLESQKASVAFSALVQVRNKLSSTLDDVLNTPL